MITYLINFQNLKVSDKDIVNNNDFEELILENEGSFTRDDQVIWFKSDDLGEDVEVSVEYEIYVSGSVDYDPGDYWTPPYTDVDINDIDIEIKSVYIDDIELELTKEIETILLNKIKQELE
jgi:hypothetical protein